MLEHPIDLLFSEYRKKPFHHPRAGLLQRLGHRLDSMVYKDEAEYLETPGLPITTQYSVVQTLSKINNRSGYTGIFLNELYSLIRQIIKDQHPAKIKILDIGAGGGGMLKAIHHWARRKKIQVELWGVDIDHEFVKITQWHLDDQKIPAKLIHGNACDLKHLGENSFDIIVSNYMVHHLRKASQVASFLSEVYRVAKRGWLIVDLNRRFWGPVFMGVGGFIFGASRIVNVDGIKSVRRAYKTREVNFIIQKLEKAGKVQNMHCAEFKVVPYWKIKGRK